MPPPRKPVTGPGILVPLGLVRSYHRDLERRLLTPLFLSIRSRLYRAEKSYKAYRKIFRDIEKDPRVLRAFAGGGRKAAAIQIAKLRRYHQKQWFAKMRRYLGVRLRPSDVIGKQLTQGFIKANVDLIVTVPKRLLGGLTSDLQKLAETKPFDEHAIAEVLRNQYGSSGYNLRRIARDQTNKIIGQLTEKRQINAGIEKYTWSTSGDERVRPTHRDNDGLEFYWGQPPATGHPGHEIQCFPGSVRINPAGLQASVAYRYIGQLVEILLTDGIKITTTPNHPILTESGWKAASAVDEGDKLLKHCRGSSLAPGSLYPEICNGDSSAEQLHRLLGGLDDVGRARGRAVDLHGEPALGHEEIEEVAVPVKLRECLESMSLQMFSNLGFESSNLRTMADGDSLPSSVASGFVGVARERFTLLGGESSHPDAVRFTGSPWFQSDVIQAAIDYAPIDSKLLGHSLGGLASVPALKDMGVEMGSPTGRELGGPRLQAKVRHAGSGNLAADSQLGCDLFDRMASVPQVSNGGMVGPATFEPVRILGVRHVSYDGPVYSFQTATGLILANGICTHNCRCVALPIIPPQRSIAQRRRRLRRFRGTNGAYLPTQSDLMDVSRRRILTLRHDISGLRAAESGFKRNRQLEHAVNALQAERVNLRRLRS